MATGKGQEFIDRYKDTDCLKASWEMVYKKGHITLDEFIECANLTEAEKLEYEQNENAPQPNEIDILEIENKQLWDTVQFLLKGSGYIPTEVEEVIPVE